MIQMYNVHMAYGPDCPGLVDASLRIPKADFVFVTGASGAGKTTLLRVIMLAERCQSGHLLLFGQNVSRIPESSVPALRRRMGVVFQDFKLLQNRSVEENVALPLEVQGKPRRVVRRRTAEVLEMVGLVHKARQPPTKLSGGEQQRVAIARAVVGDPPILLADEPTGNLDPDLSNQIDLLLKEINARGTTVVIATHDQYWVGRTEKRIIRLDRGRVQSGGIPES